LVAVREGVLSGFSLGVAAGFSFSGVLSCVFSGFSGVFVGAAEDFDAEGDGEPERSASRLVDVSSRLSALPEVPPCSIGVFVGVSPAWTLSAPPLPPSL
jgi:hypothetical protein